MEPVNPVNENIRALFRGMSDALTKSGTTKEKTKEIGEISRNLLGHTSNISEKLSSKEFNRVTATLIQDAAEKLPPKERVAMEKTIDEAYRLLESPMKRVELMAQIAIKKIHDSKDIREIKEIHQEVGRKMSAMLQSYPNDKNMHQLITNQMQELSEVVVSYQMSARMTDMIKEIAGRKFPIHDELKNQITEFCKNPEQQGKLELFLSCCEQAKYLSLAGANDEDLQHVRDAALNGWATINQMAAKSELREILTLANEFRDRFVSMNPQVHTDSMRLRLLMEIPSGAENRKKDAIQAANDERAKSALTDEEKERMKNFTNRGRFAWDKAEWVEEIKNPSPDTPFVKGERVITFLSKAPGADPKEARVPLDLEPLGKLTHAQSLAVFGFIRTSELFGMQGKDEDMKPPFEMTPEQFQKLQEIKRNFNTTLLKEMEKAYMTLDE